MEVDELAVVFACTYSGPPVKTTSSKNSVNHSPLNGVEFSVHQATPATAKLVVYTCSGVA